MAIANDDQDLSLVSLDPAIPINTVNHLQITSASNTSILTDNRNISRINLLTHVEGSEWTLQYYSQVVVTDSALSGQQLSVSAPNQQYKKIHNLKVKVTSALSSDQNDDSKTMNVTGTSILNSFIIPNDGDQFLADIGEGKLAIFLITKTTKLSIYKQACYEITYKLDSIEKQRVDDLDYKVVENLYYHDDLVSSTVNPILTSDKHSVIIELQQIYQSMINNYFKRFFSKEFKTIILPNQTTNIYDHYLVTFLLSQFNTFDCDEIRNIIKYNIQDDQVMNCDNIWHAIKYRDYSYLNTSFTKVGLIHTSKFSKLAGAHPIRYSGIRKTIYPLDPKVSVDNTIVDNVKLLDTEKLIPSTALLSSMVRALNLRNIPIDPNQELIPLVAKDDYYVMTGDFYNETTNMSVLESAVLKYIKKEQIDYTQLLDCSKTYTSWGLLEQFYYIPIILTMIKSQIYS